jgi:IS30 family transposase
MCKKYKHLTIEDREFIEELLTKDMRLNIIAEVIKKDPTTVSKEIKAKRVLNQANPFNQKYKDYKIEFNTCKRLNKFPHVCNGCPNKTGCRKEKYYYRSKSAQFDYEEELSFSRIGLDITSEEFEIIDSIVTLGLNKKQSIYHIMCSNPDLIKVSERTIYGWIGDGVMSASRADLKKAIRYKPRKQKRKQTKPKGFTLDKTYEDFLEFRKNKPDINYVQMDTVEGKMSDNKVLLTFELMNSSLLLTYIIKHQRAVCVVEQFNRLEKKLGLEKFKEIFGVILTDRGSEFSNPTGMEFSHITGERRCHIFYCDPQRSDQKGSLENVHRRIREFIPKGKSFEKFNQKQINKINSNINGTYLSSLDNKTPFNVSKAHMGSSVLKQLGLTYIAPNDIILHIDSLKD